VIWEELWYKFWLNPWFGSGFGVYDIASGSNGISFNSNGLTIEKANSYLGILEELGIVGAFIAACQTFFVLFTVSKKIAKKKYRSYENRNILLMSIFVAGLINASFEAWMYAVGSFIAVSFWIFAFVAANPE
jgi:O-antigen ligase